MNTSLGLSYIQIQKHSENKYNRIIQTLKTKKFIDIGEWTCDLFGYENRKLKGDRDLFTIKNNFWTSNVLICKKEGFKSAYSVANDLKVLMEHINYSPITSYFIRGHVYSFDDFRVYIGHIYKGKQKTSNFCLIIEFRSIKSTGADLDAYKRIIKSFVQLFLCDFLDEEFEYTIERNWNIIQSVKKDFPDNFEVAIEKQVGLTLLSLFGY